MNINGKNNFSLIEMLTVVVVIAILFAVAIGLFGLINDRIKMSRTEAIVKQMSIAMQAYRADQGYYFVNPTAFQPLSSAADPVDSRNRFKFSLNGDVDTEFIKNIDYQALTKGGYIKTITGAGGYSYVVDAWGRSLLYRTPNGNPPTNGVVNSLMFDIGSLGKDGKYGDNSTNSTDFGGGDDITNFNF